MEHQQFARIKASLVKASASQVLDLESVIHNIVARQIAEFSLARRTNTVIDSRICPHCATDGATLHGKDKNGRQRFRCSKIECNRTYNILTGTPMARARKPEKWGQYLSHMTDHLSIRNIVRAGIGVNHVTVWRWRHRFLKAAVNDNAAVLSGVIEADETFFVESHKGHRGWMRGKAPADRAARRSAWGAIKRGLSFEQIPVLTALDNAGGVYEHVLGSLNEIETALEGRISKGSVLCSDGTRAYVKAAVKAGAEHRRVVITKADYVTKTAGKPQRQKGRLGLGHVNAHHGRLKVLINGRCRGVSTRYLPSYLGWSRAMRRDGFEGRALLDRALA
jgi:transposase-like protein